MVLYNKIIKGFMIEIVKLDFFLKKKEFKCYYMRLKVFYIFCCDFDWGCCERFGWFWFRLK